MRTEIPCLAHFARDWDNKVTTDASRTGLGKNFMAKTKQQQHPTNSVRQLVTGRCWEELFDRRVELLAVVWGLEKFRLDLHGIVVYVNIDHQALEPLVKRNRAYQ